MSFAKRVSASKAGQQALPTTSSTSTSSPGPSEPIMSEAPRASTASETPTLDAVEASGGGDLSSLASGGGRRSTLREDPNVSTWGEEEALECSGPSLTPEQMQQIRGFVGQVERLLAPWAAQRMTTELVFDTSALNQLWRTFRENWRSRHQESPPLDEIGQSLRRGTIRQSVREIASYTHHLHPDYLGMLGLSARDFYRHTYRLLLREGITVAAVLGGRMVPATLRFENDAGMRWSIDGTLAIASAGASLGLNNEGLQSTSGSFGLVGADEELSPHTQSRYFTPEDFGVSAVYLLEVSAQLQGQVVGLGGSVGPEARGVSLQANGHRLSFYRETSSGRSDTAQVGANGPETNVGVSAGLTSGVGTVVGEQSPVGDASAVPELEVEQLERANPEILTVANLFFETGRAEIGGPQAATLRALAMRIFETDQRYPGALFDISLRASASPRWRGARNEADALQRNRELATRRSDNATAALRTLLGAIQPQFSAHVVTLSLGEDGSRIQRDADVANAEPGSDHEQDRMVDISVTWRPCDTSRRTGSLMLGT